MPLRLFVAVDVPEIVKQAIETDVVDPLRQALPQARWTRPEGRHLTLRFLGNVDEDRVEAIADALGRAARTNRAFEARFQEVGGFPSLRRPRVLWVGIGEGAEEMSALAATVARELDALGFAPEGRAFTPHLTLARFPRPRVIEDLPRVEVPEYRFAVEEVVLFRSQLHPKGARYTALARIPLSGGT